jgi:hypothetical protein
MILNFRPVRNPILIHQSHLENVLAKDNITTAHADNQQTT